MRFPRRGICPVGAADECQGDSFTRHGARPGLYTCAGCRRQFSITSDTAMRGTRLRWVRTEAAAQDTW